jgi:FecR-like protein
MENFQRLSELIIFSLEEIISEEQISELNEQIIHDPEARRFYVDFINIHTSILRTTDMIELSCLDSESGEVLHEVVKQDLTYSAIRHELLETEKAQRQAEAKREKAREMAEEAFRKFKEEERRRQEKLAYKRYRARQRRLVLSVGTLAACLLLVLGLWIHHKLTTDPVAPPIVARIAQSMGAQWEDPQLVTEPGTQLTATSMHLKRGLVKIVFNEGAEIVLQAPCRFKLENSNQMFLESGNVAAVVPKHTEGFMVRTVGATIVDYGTEFGVTAHVNGETEAHVFKGEVDLRSGSDIKVYRQSQRLKSGEANRVDRAGNVSPIKIQANQQRFIREISEESFSRLGRNLDLADIVGGGNGFGDGRLNYGIEPVTGELKALLAVDRMGKGQYVPIPALPFIDGVFVPDGKHAPVKISSTGHVFQDCPHTNGVYYNEIINGKMKGLEDNRGAKLNGREYGIRSHPYLFMHANLGITFDLDAMRFAMPGVEITQFEAIFGISEDAPRPSLVNADVWVLLDGKLRFRRQGVKQGTVEPIQIDIKSKDRFLTLITTDGGDPLERLGIDGMKLKSTDSDWCVFAVPTLIVQPE